MRIRTESIFLLTIISIFSILFFATSVVAQELKNRALSPQEEKDLGFDTGNPPGPYWKSGPDSAAGKGVYVLNHDDKTRRAPRDGTGTYSISCDSRQDPRLYNGKAYYERGGGNRFDEAGNCTQTNTSSGKTSRCCVNQKDGYAIQPGEPAFEITKFHRESCSRPEQSDGPPGFPGFRDQRVCDLIAAEGATIADPGNPGGGIGGGDALTVATEARVEAEQRVTTAQGTLESAQSAVQTAQQTLTTAQETLVSATSALQEAERAVEDETQQKAELIRVAEQAVQEAEQNLQTAQQELDSARSALQELEQQIATAQGTVTTAEGKQQELNTLLLQAQAEVARLMGNSSGMPPMDGGVEPLERLRLSCRKAQKEQSDRLCPLPGEPCALPAVILPACGKYEDALAKERERIAAESIELQ